MRPVEIRFWEKVDKNGPISKEHPELGRCWIWIAGRTRKGYGRIKVSGKQIQAHRLSFKMTIGPINDDEEIDHLCANPACVRGTHLRKATHSQNQCNKGKTTRNSSGFKGVCWHSGEKKWVATIQINKKKHHLGYFHDPVSAHEAYCEAAKQFHMQFANTG